MTKVYHAMFVPFIIHVHNHYQFAFGQVEVQENTDFLAEFLGQFCDKIPNDAEMEDWFSANVNTHARIILGSIFIIAFAMPCMCDKEALGFISINYGLNPQYGDSLAEHTVSCRIIDGTDMLFGPSLFDQPKTKSFL